MSLSKSKIKFKSLVKLNDLPEDILRMIMLLVPLQVRISKRVVCRRWKQIIEDTFGLVRSLKLFDSYHILSAHYCPLLLERGLQGDQDLVLSKHESDDLVLGGTLTYEYDDLVYDILADGQHSIIAPSGGHFLVNLFPNVEKLIVATVHNSTRIDFDDLLAHFAPKLTTLAFVKVNITGKLKHYMKETYYRGLGPQLLSSLSNLRALHLHEATFGAYKPSLNLSTILPRLETLSIMRLSTVGLQFKFLAHTRTLKHLNIGFVTAEEINIFCFLASANAQLASQLESLSVGWFFDGVTALVDSLCIHFGALRKLHLNLSDEQHLNVDDELKSLDFFFTALAKLTKLTDLSFKIECDYFEIDPEDLATVPVMRNIVYLKMELLYVSIVDVALLERCLLVIFPNATRILLRTPFRESMDWLEGRDRLVEMVERNPAIMRIDGTEELEVDVAPLLGRHEDNYQRECLGEGMFGLYEVTEEEEEDSEDDEAEEEEQNDNFLGISIELLTLLSEEETLDFRNPFRTGSQLQKMEAFKQILSTHVPELDCSTNYETMLTALNTTFTEQVAEIPTRQIAILALECIRLIATESKPGRFPVDAKPWISILLYHFGSEYVIGRMVDSLNAALDAICRTTPFNVMVNQIELPLVHPDPSVRKATALLVYRALSQVEPERIIINGDDANQNNDALVSVGAQLAREDESEEVRVALRLAHMEWNKVNQLMH